MTFAIIRYYIRAFGQDAAVWERVGTPDPYYQPAFLTHKEALQIIKENKMVLVCDNEYGKIWDFPDHRWTNKWKGVFKQRNNMKALAKKMERIKRNAKKDKK